MPSESSKSSSESSLVTVDSSAKVSLSSDVSSFIEALNPLGNLAKTVSEIIACRIEIKRLHNQAQEVRQRLQNEAQEAQHEYQINSKKVDATLKIALQALEDRRAAMDHFFKHAENEMRQHHIYGNQIVRSLQNMTELMNKKDEPFEVRQLALEGIKSLSKDLVSSQREGSERLKVLVQSTRNDLRSVPSLAGLLPPEQ